MANIDNPNGFKLSDSLVGKELLDSATLDASQAIKKGDALAYNAANGRVVIYSGHDAIYGFAAQAATTGAGESKTIRLHPAVPWNLFRGQTSGTFATSMIGRVCDIEGTTGIMEVNEDSLAERVIQIVDYDRNYEVGANSRVIFRVVRSSYLANKQDLLEETLNVQLITTDTTLDAQDSGYFNIITAATDVTITLPATAAGIVYNFVNAVAPGAILISIDPAAADYITGCGLTAVDNKDLLNTKATAKPGDMAIIHADGTVGWFIAKLVGTWAKEA